MTTVNIPIGSTVYVNWYGHTVPAEVIDRAKHCTHPWSDEWIPVEMTIPSSDGKPIVSGCKNISIFHMRHVYSTPDEAQTAWQEYQQQWQNRRTAPKVEAVVPAPSPAAPPAAGSVSCGSTASSPSLAWQRVQQFKRDHWDAARNHLRIEALDAFYALWRDSIAAKYGLAPKEPAPAPVPPVEATAPVAVSPADAPKAPAPQLPPITFVKPKGPIKATQLSFDFQ